MKAVAMMTPEPKYLATKKTDLGMRILFERAARTGNSAPEVVLDDCLFVVKAEGT